VIPDALLRGRGSRGRLDRRGVRVRGAGALRRRRRHRLPRVREPDFRGPKRHAEECEAARRWRETPYVVDGVMLHVDDVDGHFEQARSAGATILSELEDNPYAGQRQYRAEDLEGHRWMFAQLT
jgi:hypothetical protein